jgi:hypothetical protein
MVTDCHLGDPQAAGPEQFADLKTILIRVWQSPLVWS